MQKNKIKAENMQCRLRCYADKPSQDISSYGWREKHCGPYDIDINNVSLRNHRDHQDIKQAESEL